MDPDDARRRLDDEIEVLQSIYPDAGEVTVHAPDTIEVLLPLDASSYLGAGSSSNHGLSVRFTLPPGYPASPAAAELRVRRSTAAAGAPLLLPGGDRDRIAAALAAEARTMSEMDCEAMLHCVQVATDHVEAVLAATARDAALAASLQGEEEAMMSIHTAATAAAVAVADAADADDAANAADAANAYAAAAAASGSGGGGEAGEAAAAVARHQVATLGRRVMYSHHIINPNKRKVVVQWAVELDLGGFSKIGWPGVILVEGPEWGCQEYVSRMQHLRWKHFVVRGEEVVRGRVGQTVDAMRKAP